MRTFIVFFGFSALLAASAVGCSIEVNEGHDPFDDWDTQTQDERAADVCDPYCIDLIDCGALSENAFVSCRDLCMERFAANESNVTQGCACVQAAACSAPAASVCEGDPLPGVLDDSDTSSAGGSGGTSSAGGGDYSVDSCSTNHDCLAGEDCLENKCQARCAASCQCGEGDACVEGYCTTPEVPTIECETDCDCTSGETCESGICR